ncbi:anti-sigma factor [Kineococcus endophyticus]|uniref:Anti-sigma factor n=1 Tax=Kineococcus endophyticus TaxID=1181883 RepID=A0ABV3P562_9ACTN
MRPTEGTGVPHLDEDEAALAGLGEPLGAAAHQHLADCEECRAEVAGWARLGAARAAEDVQALAPPAGTWDRIAHEVGFDAATSADTRPTVLQAVPPLAPSPSPARLDGHRRARPAGRGPRRRLAPPVAAAALAGLLVGGVAGVAGSRLATGSEPVAARPSVVSSATLRPPGATDEGVDGPGGTAQVADEDGSVRLHLTVHGVSSPAQGYLEAWLLDADGGMVSLGTMAGDDMTVTVPAGVDLSRFDVVDVSREPLDGDPGHSSDSVLRGRLSQGA